MFALRLIKETGKKKMTEIIVQSQYKRCDSEAIGKYILKTAKRKNYKVYAALATIIIALSIILLQIPPFNRTSNYMLIITGVLVLIALNIFVACAPAITKKGSVAANKSLEGSYMLHAFYDDYYFSGCESPVGKSEQSFRYLFVDEVFETSEHFLLFLNNTACEIVPKRDMSPEQIAEASAFFAAKFAGRFKKIK